MKIKAVIFDLDGVICFTDHYHYLAWKELADKLGLPFDEQKNNRIRGVSRMDSLEIVLEESDIQYTKEEKEAMASQKNTAYQKLLLSMTPRDVSKEIWETLVTLRGRGLKLAIGSSSKNAPLILRQTGMQDFFDAVSDGNNISHSKPDPEVFLKAAEMLHLSPAECVVMEDAFAGIEAACRGGFYSIGIGDAAACPNATWNVSHFSEIISILERQFTALK